MGLTRILQSRRTGTITATAAMIFMLAVVIGVL